MSVCQLIICPVHMSSDAGAQHDPGCNDGTILDLQLGCKNLLNLAI